MRWVWLGALGVVACGPVVGMPQGDGSEEGEASSGVGATSEGGASAAEESSGASAADESTSTGEPGIVLCGAVDPSQPLAVLSDAASAEVLLADGTLRALDLPQTAAPADASIYPVFAGRGEHIAALRSWAVFLAGVEYGSELALLDASGAQIWAHGELGSSLSTVHLGDDGSIASMRSYEDGASEGVVFFGADDELVLPDFMPMGPRRADGWVPGSLIGPKGNSIVSWMSSELVVQEVRYTPIWSWDLRADGDYVYLAHGDDVPMLVIDTPTQATTVPIPALGGVDPVVLSVRRSPSLAWLLVHDDGTRWWRIEVASGATEELELTPPEGASVFECYQPAAVIDDVGRVLLSTRDATAAAVLRFDPASASWTQLGERVTFVDDIGATAHGETVVVQSSGTGTTFCPAQEFETGTAVLAGSTRQLLRPIDGYSQVLDPDTAAIPDATGTCVAMTSLDGLTIVDVPQQLELPPSALFGITWWRR